MKKQIVILLTFVLGYNGITIAEDITATIQKLSELTSPQTANIIRYGNNPNVARQYGTLNLNLPLYTIKDKDFDFPIEMCYAADGFKPRKHSEYCGYNWYLSAGGCITREIKGLADETELTPTSNPITGGGDEYLIGFLKYTRQNPHSAEEAYNIEDFDLEDYSPLPIFYAMPKDFYHNGNDIHKSLRIDCTPDIYHFSFCGHNGSFTINNQGEPIIIDGDFLEIDLSDLSVEKDLSINHSPRASTISVKTMDGYTFEFGGSESSVAYSTDYSIMISTGSSVCYSGDLSEYPRTGDGTGGNTTMVSPINCWYLTKIIAPNYREIQLDYEGNWDLDIAFSYPPGNSKESVVTSLLHSVIMGIPSDVLCGDLENILVENNYRAAYFSWTRMRQIYLKKICVVERDSSISLIVEFTNEENPQAALYTHGDAQTPDITYDLFGNLFSVTPLTLTDMNVYRIENNQAISMYNATFQYRITTNSRGNSWSFLEKINTSLGVYQMSYNSYKNSSLFPDVDKKITLEDDVNGYINDSSKLMLGTLSSIKYPTGGTQTFEYTPNHICHSCEYFCFAPSKRNLSSELDRIVIELKNRSEDVSKHRDSYAGMLDETRDKAIDLISDRDIDLYMGDNFGNSIFREGGSTATYRIPGITLKSIKSYDFDGLVKETNFTYHDGHCCNPYVQLDNLCVNIPSYYNNMNRNVLYTHVQEETKYFMDNQVKETEIINYYYTNHHTNLQQNGPFGLKKRGAYNYLTGDIACNEIKELYDISLRFLCSWNNSGDYQFSKLVPNTNSSGLHIPVAFYCDQSENMQGATYSIAQSGLAFGDNILSSNVGVLYRQTIQKEKNGEVVYSKSIDRTFNSHVFDTIGVYTNINHWTVSNRLYIVPNLLNRETITEAGVTISKLYEYDDKYRVTRVTTTNGDGNDTHIRFLYPDKFTYLGSYSTGIQFLKNKNIIGSPIETLYSSTRSGVEYVKSASFELPCINRQLYGGQWKREYYKLSLSTPLVYNSQHLTVIQEKVTFMQNECEKKGEIFYNNMFRPIRVIRVGELPIKYIWQNDQLVQKTCGDLSTYYTFVPYIGMTSVTDERGMTTYYNYDSMGRLIEIYRLNNGIKEVIKKIRYYEADE